MYSSRAPQFQKYSATNQVVFDRWGVQYKVDRDKERLTDIYDKIRAYKSYFYVVSHNKSFKFGISEHPSTGAQHASPQRLLTWLRWLNQDGRVHAIYGFTGKKSAYAFESNIKLNLKDHPDLEINGSEYITRGVFDPDREPGEIDLRYQRTPVGDQQGDLTKFLDILEAARTAWDTTDPLRDMYKDIEGMRVSEQPDEATGLYYRIPSDRIELLKDRRARMQAATTRGGGGAARMPNTIRPAVRNRAVKIRKTAAIHTPSRINRRVGSVYSTRGLRRSGRVQGMVTRTVNSVRSRR